MDRGSQYCSVDYQKLLREHKLICSMSKRGDCYDIMRQRKAGIIVLKLRTFMMKNLNQV